MKNTVEKEINLKNIIRALEYHLDTPIWKLSIYLVLIIMAVPLLYIAACILIAIL